MGANEKLGAAMHGQKPIEAQLVRQAQTITKLKAALEAVEDQCAYWDTLAPGDKHYAARIRTIINEHLGD